MKDPLIDYKTYIILRSQHNIKAIDVKHSV